MFVYFFTCWLSGVVELGTVLWGISCGYSLVGCFGLALAYQLGNALCFLIGKKTSRLMPVCYIFCAFVCGAIWLIPAQEVKYALACVLFAVFSTSLQNMRSAAQGNVPRWQKRTCRVVGFLCSASMYFFGIPVLAAASVILLILSFITPNFYRDRWLRRMMRGEFGENKISWPMITHQAHYFAYTYVMLFIVMKHYNHPLAATIWFAANWVPYTITEPLVQLTKWKNWLAIVIGAHLFNAVVLLLMYLSVGVDIRIALCLWILTGFGGGNVFCLKRALSPTRVYDKDVWSFSEQLGHLLGSVCGIGICLLDPSGNWTLLLGALFALSTIPVTLWTRNHKKSLTSSRVERQVL